MRVDAPALSDEMQIGVAGSLEAGTEEQVRPDAVDLGATGQHRCKMRPMPGGEARWLGLSNR
jgi:hypothetical protein